MRSDTIWPDQWHESECAIPGLAGSAPVVSAPHARHEIRHRMPALATLNRVEMPIRLAVLFEGPRPVPVVSSVAMICDLAVKHWNQWLAPCRSPDSRL